MVPPLDPPLFWLDNIFKWTIRKSCSKLILQTKTFTGITPGALMWKLSANWSYLPGAYICQEARSQLILPARVALHRSLHGCDIRCLGQEARSQLILPDRVTWVPARLWYPRFGQGVTSQLILPSRVAWIPAWLCYPAHRSGSYIYQLILPTRIAWVPVRLCDTRSISSEAI
jgi:hypothetical protein